MSRVSTLIEFQLRQNDLETVCCRASVHEYADIVECDGESSVMILSSAVASAVASAWSSFDMIANNKQAISRRKAEHITV
jgi:hypothetical protein